MTMSLTVPERDELARCEEIIERGLATFVEVGTALLRVRDGRLYPAERVGTTADEDVVASVRIYRQQIDNWHDALLAARPRSLRVVRVVLTTEATS